ncbi:DUF6397 family protein [Streptomyces sp. NBC_00138]|uniref:DUF6397 family protein n=1 Tax=Streptomyces sp. NBC_00138 TaxID=2903625 RepID=UPI0032493704
MKTTEVTRGKDVRGRDVRDEEPRAGGVPAGGVRAGEVRAGSAGVEDARARAGSAARRELSARSKGIGPAPGAPPGSGTLLTLGRARDTLGLDHDDFDVAVQIGEVRTVACGPRVRKVPAAEVARLLDPDGRPQALLDRVRLVSSTDAAKQLGIGRDRFVRLARLGYVRPLRWYVNRYRALVWMYPVQELPDLADQHPALLRGPLPEGLRGAVASGEDQRARGWRSRRVAQLLRDAYDPWEEAAVWAALLGPEAVDQALPDPYERAHLRRLRRALPPGRTGAATPEQIKEITTADHPDEIATALLALSETLVRARAHESAPALVPPTVGPLPVSAFTPSAGLVATSVRPPAAPTASALGLAPMPPAGVPEMPTRQSAAGSLPLPASAAPAGPVIASALGLTPVPPAGLRAAPPWPSAAGPLPAASAASAGPAIASAPGLTPVPPAGLAVGPAVRRVAEPPPPRAPGPVAVSVDRGRVVPRGLRRLLRGGGSAVGAARRLSQARARAHSSPTSVSRITARPSSSEAARSTSADRPQP